MAVALSCQKLVVMSPHPARGGGCVRLRRPGLEGLETNMCSPYVGRGGVCQWDHLIVSETGEEWLDTRTSTDSTASRDTRSCNEISRRTWPNCCRSGPPTCGPRQRPASVEHVLRRGPGQALRLGDSVIAHRFASMLSVLAVVRMRLGVGPDDPAGMLGGEGGQVADLGPRTAHARP